MAFAVDVLCFTADIISFAVDSVMATVDIPAITDVTLPFSADFPMFPNDYRHGTAEYAASKINIGRFRNLASVRE
ncbi:hypothetical protein [Sporolactobacillus sp. KGMB 08714]|uniref:hypothetical protein n=2 Tax=unclassified Sporolactobacillus TaxID=2628533 RepID=UPI002FBE982F